MKKSAKQARQGDVFIEKVSTIPNSATKRKLAKGERLILAYGEVSTHAHAIMDPGVTCYDDGENMFIESNEPFSVKHEEHDPINLEAGVYRAFVQREYSRKEIQRVKD